MTTVKRKSDGTTEIIEDAARVPVGDGESVFAQATEAAAANVLPAWASGTAYSVDDIVSYNGRLWRVVQAHTSQVDWLPDIAYSLFVETWPAGVIPDWSQPQGSHDAYPAGFEVYHVPTDRIWVSDIDANVWEPNSAADTWTLRDDQEPLEPDTDEWQAGTAYTVGDLVTYQETTYECLQAHTAIVGWQPPNVPALWTVA
jgi:chitinase